MKKINILKIMVIAIPIATGIFAQFIENRSLQYDDKTAEKKDQIENSDVISNNIAEVNY